MKDSSQNLSVPQDKDAIARRIRFVLLVFFQSAMAVELFFLLQENLWMNSVWLLFIMIITSGPAILGNRMPVRIPLEYEVLSIIFVFASLFLGEFRSYYRRFWWWDIALHATSGLLLGILGFLLVYVLNESKRIDMHMRPGFVALFAFLFALSAGTMWEIFEFLMDQFVGTKMQKPMLGDNSGLTDTMCDLMVDCLGAAIISCFGWWNLKNNARSFLDRWIEKFIEYNPWMFSNSG